MHTRRFASFLLGAWLLASLLMMYVANQAQQNVDRMLASPPGAVSKDIDDLGTDVAHMLLTYQASQLNRFLTESWGVLQLGLGAAFICVCLLTSHRSKLLLIGASVMVVLVAIQMWYLAPAMLALGRSFDFLPASAALKDRESYHGFSVWNSLLEALKLLIGGVLAVRLLFDRYAWRQEFGGGARRVQRRRRRHHRTPIEPAEGEIETAADEPASEEQAKAADATSAREHHRD